MQILEKLRKSSTHNTDNFCLLFDFHAHDTHQNYFTTHWGKNRPSKEHVNKHWDKEAMTTRIFPFLPSLCFCDFVSVSVLPIGTFSRVFSGCWGKEAFPKKLPNVLNVAHCTLSSDRRRKGKSKVLSLWQLLYLNCTTQIKRDWKETCWQ